MRSIIAALLSAVWVSSLATPALAAPRNILLARDRTEPVVAIDPVHPATIIAGSNTNYNQAVNGRYPVGFYTSRNGGRTFSAGSIPTMSPYTIGADPTVAFASSGTAFYTYLGESPAYCGGGAGTGAVMLSRSTDGGRGFGQPVVVDADSADDKPNLAIESIPGARAHVIVTWTRWLSGHSEIWMARSVNGGDTFGAPQLIASSNADNFGSVPVLGPGGHVYVFWATFPDMSLTSPAPTRILLRSSANDGRSFGPVQVAAGTFAGVPRMAQPGLLRNLTIPTVTDDHGALFLAYAAVTGHRARGAVNSNIDITMSTNGGMSWTHPVPVNDVHAGDRFMPAIGVMHDGSLGVAFYDRRNSPWSLDTYAARVQVVAGLPRASVNVRVNAGNAPISDIYYIKPGSTCFSPGRFFGDYIGVAADRHDRLCVVWANTEAHVNSRTDVWFARVSLPSALPLNHRVVRPRAQRHDFWRLAGNFIQSLGSGIAGVTSWSRTAR